MVYCFTSGKRFHWRELDSGHFITAKLINTRWNELNVFPQSIGDNRVRHGMQKKYRSNLVEIYGEKVVKELEEKSKKHWNPSVKELKALITKYENKLKRLRGSKYIGKKYRGILVMFFDPTNPAKRICKVDGKMKSLYTKQINSNVRIRKKVHKVQG